jgi:hypothetical protein
MPTIGEIARRLGEPVHRIEYVLRTRDIRPSGIAGNCRVYDEQAIRLIHQELQRIASTQRSLAKSKRSPRKPADKRDGTPDVDGDSACMDTTP